MIYVVLPAYNEEKNIKPLLEKIDLTMKEHHRDYKIVLINDGSSDGTQKIVEALAGIIPMDIITHDKNRGLGETLKTGILHAVKIARDNDVIVTMDADNSHTPGLIMRLDRNIWEGCDVVIASRFMRNARIVGVPSYRKFLGYAASLLFRIFFPIKGVKEYTCGFRAYRAGMLKEGFSVYGNQFMSEPGFSCQIDILLKLKRFHPIINEVPLILRYDQRKGASKMDVEKTIRETLKLFVKRLFKR